MRLLSSLLALVLVAAGCTASRPGGGPDLASTMWRLTEMSGDTPAIDGATVAFGADGRISGTTGCNRFTGAYDLDGDHFDFSPLATTRMACAPAAAEQERRVLAALAGAERATVEGGRLVLSGEGGTLAFRQDGSAMPDFGGMPPQETGLDFAYTCDTPGGPFTFRIRTGPGEIALWLPKRFESREGGTYRVLGQVRAASGVRYEDGPVTVWTHQGEALLEVDGQTYAGCRP